MKFNISELDAVYMNGEWAIRDQWSIGHYSPRKNLLEFPDSLGRVLKNMGCPYGSLKYIKHGSGAILAVSKEDGCPKFFAIPEDGETNENRTRTTI